MIFVSGMLSSAKRMRVEVSPSLNNLTGWKKHAIPKISRLQVDKLSRSSVLITSISFLTQIIGHLPKCWQPLPAQTAEPGRRVDPKLYVFIATFPSKLVTFIGQTRNVHSSEIRQLTTPYRSRYAILYRINSFGRVALYRNPPLLFAAGALIGVKHVSLL